jgi:hypothetical protein
MKTKSLLFTLAAISLCTSLLGQRKSFSARRVPPGLEARVKQFFADKKGQAHGLAKDENQPQMSEVWDFFAAGENGDWQAVANIYGTLRRGAYQYEGGRKEPRLETMVWQPINECFGAYDLCSNGSEKYITNFAQGILASMPPGSIYFGGTDSGRWLVTAFSKSHMKAEPCFVLTQNALADGLYLKYLHVMYGGRIGIPTEGDSKKAFEDYVADASRRLKEDKLQPGENVTDVEGKVQVSGQVAVMQINARLARKIFEANPGREVFIEESFPLDWMYPYLAPHGLIMQINGHAFNELPEKIVQKDRDVWRRFTEEALGKWLKEETSVEAVCEFATATFEGSEMKKFKCDPQFVRNDYARKMFSKLRSSIGGLYAWRSTNSVSQPERKRMVQEADFAFRQAFALCPYSPEPVYRYAGLLVEQGRKKDALLLAQTAERLDPGNGGFARLAGDLEENK